MPAETPASAASRLYLSPPHLDGRELELVKDAFASNWIAPLGPQVDAFEREFAAALGGGHAAALSSGTAALHLALELAGVGPGTEVLCSTLTFVASANPIRYLGATPVFVDSERRSWNMDPALLAQELDDARRAGRRVSAVVLVHLYGQCADLAPIREACARHEVPLVEDAAEALGAEGAGVPAGTSGRCGVFSFNGNKIITTSGGGMLFSRQEALVKKARELAAQAREPAPHYEHVRLGYNYRMSNVLAAIGRGQLQVLADRVRRRRANHAFYERALGGTPGLSFIEKAPWGEPTRWLTVLEVDPRRFGATTEGVRLHLEAAHIEARPVWKPLHLQPLFRGCRVVGGRVAESAFARGLCLPSGSQMEEVDLARVAARVLDTPGRRS